MAEQFKCKNEGCTYVGTKAGYLTQHEKICKFSKGDNNNKGGHKAPTQKTYSKIVICPECKGSKVHLLSSRDRDEKELIDAGGMFLCEACDEVFK